MIKNAKSLFDLLDTFFIPHGFVRKKDTYYLNTEECICFFSIDKSGNSSGFFSNVMGCFVKALMEEQNAFPSYYKNHVRYNIDQFIGKKKIREIFSLENDIFKDDEREKQIKKVIEKYALPFLSDLTSEAKIAAATKKYGNLIHFIVGDATTYLEIGL